MIKKEIDKLNLNDNFMFANVMSDKVICRMFLEKLLGIEIEEIEISQYEKTIFAGVESKDIRLDVYVKDKLGKVYDIEMQNRSESGHYNLAKRARYYQSVIDTEELREGHHYSELPESYIIFICAFDEFGLGKHRYTFRYKCDEAPELILQNEAKLIILSTRGTEKSAEIDPEITAFLRYIENSNEETVSASGSDFLRRVHKRFESIKKEKRDAVMTLEEHIEMEGRIIRKEALQEGLSKGREEANLETAVRMKAEGFADDVISRLTGVSEEKVAAL